MRSRLAFTLIELLLAMSLASLIILGMMQGQRNVMKFLDTSRKLMTINRKICLLFNQMERDFSAACILELDQKKKDKDKEKTADQNTNMPRESSIQQQTASKKKKKTAFLIKIQDDMMQRIHGKTYQLFDQASFITTSPLQVYGQQKSRLVRVGYQLQLDKKNKHKDIESYLLIRKETSDITNIDFKQPEEENAQNWLRWHIVAQGVRCVHIKCCIPESSNKEQKEKRDETGNQDDTIITSSVWGQNNETIGILPQSIVITVAFYKEDSNDSNLFECSIPMLNFNRRSKEKEREAELSIDNVQDTDNRHAKEADDSQK